MRHLRTYICVGGGERGQLGDESYALMEEMRKIRAESERLSAYVLSELQKIVPVAYAHALRWNIKLPKYVAHDMKELCDKKELLTKERLRPLFFGKKTRNNPVLRLFDAVAAMQFSARQINGVVYLRLDETSATFRRGSATVSIEHGYYYGTRILHYSKFAYVIKRGSVGRSETEALYNRETSISMNRTQSCSINIVGCRLYYTRLGGCFGYHICTNTFYYDAQRCRMSDIECTRARATELYCLRRQILHKIQSHMKVANGHGLSVPNFL